MRALSAIVLLLVSACARPTVEAPPRPPTAAQLFALGGSYARQGDLTRAEQYMAGALRAGHAPEETLRALLAVCVRAGRMRHALGHARHRLHLRPDDWRLRQLVAALHLALGELDEADGELREVVRRNPTIALPHYTLGRLWLEHRGSPEAARAHFAGYLERAPDGRHAAQARAALARL